MSKLGFEAIYPKPNLSKPGKDHLTYPYLLKGVAIDYSDQIRATDLTYIRIGSGFVYSLKHAGQNLALSVQDFQ